MTRRLLFPAVLLLALYYAVFGGEYSVFDVRNARVEREEAETRLAALEAEVEALRARADSLEQDPAALERIAREKFGMIQEGEILYRVVPPEDDGSPDAPGSEG